MPSFSLRTGVSFSYTDSGAPRNQQTDYVTLILLHGIIFHNGTFASLAAIGPSNGVRVIAINRRGYPGTTPYSAEELALFVSGNEDDKERLLADMGRDLALLIAELITSLSLPAYVAVVEWSLGSLQVLSLVASIETLPQDARGTLTRSVRSMILFREPFDGDPADQLTAVFLESPSVIFGVADPQGLYIPQNDPHIPANELGTFFSRWVSSFFVHGDLSTRDACALTYDRTDPHRLPTTARIPMNHLTDFAAGFKYDATLISSSFSGVAAKLVDKTLFDVHVRGELLKDTRFFVLSSSADSWTTIYASWKLEERMLAEAKPECSITFKMVEGANHFFMIEDPQGTIDCFMRCCA